MTIPRFAAHRATPRSRGLSLVETMCCTAATATLLGGAAPALSEFGSRQRLQAVAAELRADIGLARSSAIQRGAAVRLSWQTLGNGDVCYMVHTGDADACNCAPGPQAQCHAGTESLRTVVLPAQQAITLSAATRSILFDAHRNTVTPTATFRLGDRHGHGLNVVVNIMGRVRTCSSGESMAGIRSC